MKNMVTKTLSQWLLVALIAGGGIACEAKDAPKVNLSDREVDRSAPGASYATVIKKVTPSVVTIQSTRTVRYQQNWHPFFDDEMFRRFFPDMQPRQDRSRERRQVLQGLGSGVIVSEDGYILTNNHVVEGADEDGVKVALADGKTKYDAKVVGRDPRTDVAVLKIEAQNLPAITIA
jgi:serine protease Do